MALMEGLNSLSQTVNRKACAYRTVGYMIFILYLIVGKLTLSCR